jgi:hypothetical protein
MSGFVRIRFERRRICPRAVVDRRSYPVPQPEGVERPCLVLGESLRRIEVESASLGVAQQHVERRQVEAQRLARGGPGRRYDGSAPGSLECLELVFVELRHPGGCQRLEQARVEIGRGRGEAGGACVLERLTDEELTAASAVEQLGPRLDRPRRSRAARGLRCRRTHPLPI